MQILFSQRGGERWAGEKRAGGRYYYYWYYYLSAQAIYSYDRRRAGTLEQLLRITFGTKRVDDEAVDEISDSPRSIFLDDAMTCNARCPHKM